MISLLHRSLERVLDGLDENGYQWFFEHFYDILPRQPWREEFTKICWHRNARIVRDSIISMEHHILTDLIEMRLISRMRGQNMVHTRWLEDAFRQTMRCFCQLYAQEDVKEVLNIFQKFSWRRFLFFETPKSPLSVCLVKAHGDYGGHRKQVLFCFLDIPLLPVMTGDDKMSMQYPWKDPLVDKTIKICKDTDHAIVSLYKDHTVRNAMIVSEWRAVDVFRFWNRW